MINHDVLPAKAAPDRTPAEMCAGAEATDVNMAQATADTTDAGNCTFTRRWDQWAEQLQLPATELSVLPPSISDRRTFYVYILSHNDESVLAAHPTSLRGGKAFLSAYGQEGEILRDIPRTMFDHVLFQGRSPVGQHLLANVLRAVLYACPHVGYCQGMNLIAASLLVARIEQESASADSDWQIDTTDELLALAAHVDINSHSSSNNNSSNSNSSTGGAADEENEDCAEDDSNESPYARKAFISNRTALDVEADVFWLIVSMIKSDKLSMGDLWQPGIPAVKMRAFQADVLLREELPDLHRRLEQIGLPSEILTTQWLITLFAYILPLDMTLGVWSHVFQEGWSGVLSLVLALFSHLKPVLNSSSMDEFGAKMRFWREHGLFVGCTASDLICTAQSYNVTQARLAALQEAYGMELIRRYEPSAERGEAQEHEYHWLFQQYDPLDLMRDASWRNLRFGLSLFRHVFVPETSLLESQLREICSELKDASLGLEACASATARALETLRRLFLEPEDAHQTPMGHSWASERSENNDMQASWCNNSTDLLDLIDWVVVDHLQSASASGDFCVVSPDAHESQHRALPSPPTTATLAESIGNALLWLVSTKQHSTNHSEAPSPVSRPAASNTKQMQQVGVTGTSTRHSCRHSASQTSGWRVQQDRARTKLSETAQHLQQEYRETSECFHAMQTRLNDLQACKVQLSMQLLHCMREAERRSALASHHV